MTSPVVTNGPAESSTVPRRFECAFPGCRKVFRRKEHLTRHLKSHDTQPQYVCHICGRRYARSDVLKRHVEFHPQYYKSKRNFIACTSCRESKTKCDEDNPCKPCHRRKLQCVRVDRGESAVNADSAALESTSDVSSPPPSSTHVPKESRLGEYIFKDCAALERRLDAFFARIHPTWPVLQPAMVTASGSPELLVASIVMLVSWLEGDMDHVALSPLVFNEILESHLGPNPPLAILQAMVLYLLYSTCCLETEGMAFKALRIHNALVTACRFSGIFASQRGILYAWNHASTAEEDQEPRDRLAFAALRLDAYLTALLDFPPLIRYQELSMPISQSTCWVAVASEEERRKLLEDEPALRRKTSFSFRVHDLFGAPRPNVLASRWTRMDYHFILCAIQSGAWEACHQAIRTVPDDIHSRTHPHDLRTAWRQYLKTLHRDYFAILREDDISPQTLLLWHMTTLKLHAPPDLWALQGRYYELCPSGAAVRTRAAQPPTSLRPWQASEVARVAVWHGAQISRLVSDELSSLDRSSSAGAGARVRLNPLLLPALLTAAAVALGYAHLARACPLCTGGGAIDLVSVFAPPGDCERLGRWLAEGAGLASWGPDVFAGFPLCRCAVPRLAGWFRALLLLARHAPADAALARLVDEFRAGLWGEAALT
ncbi:hypothetical protein F4802DRAFT_617868 [Xylaria palmicola]|nr:hypothetical protein F4802DRAFT_617868 [Xylaria palmicola]